MTLKEHKFTVETCETYNGGKEKDAINIQPKEEGEGVGGGES